MVSLEMRQAQVAASRRREAQRLEAIREVQSEGIIKNRAKWEQQAQSAIERCSHQGSKHRVRILRSANLNHRRDCLRNKLDVESKRLARELSGREETPQMKRERMLLRARVIKEKTEAERRTFVEQAYDKQFRLQCDELRSTKTELLNSHCEGIQNEQLKQKQLSDCFRREQDLKYDRLWVEDMNRKAERERRDIESKMRIQREINEAVEEQLEDLHQRQRAAQQHREAEKQMRLELEAQMKREQANDRVVQQQSFAKRRQDAMEYTQQSRDEKLHAAEREKQLDRAYIEDILAREAREKKQELEKKSMTTQDIAGFLEYTRKAKESRRNREMQLDVMRQAALDADMRRRDEVLQAESKARDNLNKQVLRERRGQIGLKKSSLQHQQLEDRLERQRMIDRHAALEAQEKETQLAQRKIRLNVQKDQWKQIQDNSRFKEDEIRATEKEREQIRLEKEQYDRRVDALRHMDAERSKLFGSEESTLIEKQHAAYSYPRKKLIT